MTEACHKFSNLYYRARLDTFVEVQYPNSRVCYIEQMNVVVMHLQQHRTFLS